MIGLAYPASSMTCNKNITLLLFLNLDSKDGFIYSETSIYRFRWGSEKETVDPGKQ
jgi:hypothetical protein